MHTAVLLSGQPTKKTEYCVFHSVSISLPECSSTTDNLHVEAPSELLELQKSSLVNTRYNDLGADFKK